MTAPGYQTILDRDIPSIALPDDAGRVRVIAGEYEGRHGPAHTFTPIDVWDLRLKRGRAANFTLPAGRSACARRAAWRSARQRRSVGR